MPCYTDPHSYCKHDSTKREEALCDAVSALEKLDNENKHIFENLRDELSFYKNQSDKLTDMLCRVLHDMQTMIYKDPEWYLKTVPMDIQIWYEKHKKWDKKQKENK
jgi:hypothetical protein